MHEESGIEKLRRTGANAISRQTHIPKRNVERLLAEDFSSFSPVQLSGFIRILEREYGVDLSSWKAAAFTQSHDVASTPPTKPESADDPFAHAAKTQRRKQYVVWVFAALLAIAIAVTVMVLGTAHGKTKIELNNTAIDKARENLESLAASSHRSTLEAVETIQRQREREAASSSSEALEYDEVVIRPRTKVWLGVIDAKTHKRYTRTTSQPWELDGNRTWLIVTGHGLLSIECGGVNASFAQRDRLLFLYEDGKCREIDTEEFRARNRGRIW